MIINPTYPGGFVIFCDDVRFELGGKTTYVGVYGDEMLFSSSGPVQVPQLCAVIAFRIYADQAPFEGTFRITKASDEKVLAEGPFEFSSDDENGSEPYFGSEPDPAVYLEQNIVVTLRKFVIDKSDRIKVRAYWGDNEYRLGSMQVVLATAGDETTS
jgi:hypothetical protein